jgi:ketosteroid isomerase-like protein
MRRLLLVVAIVMLASSALDAQTRLGTAEDEAAIRQRRQAAVAAWNKHDSKAIAELFATDVDGVRSNGSYYSGRTEVEASFADTLAASTRTQH